jgi:metallo-beta-lactamase family protein
MAHRVSEVYCRHLGDLDEDMKAATLETRCPLCCKTYHLVESIEESKSINRMKGPLIVIAGSGMATGGRILHHLSHRLPDPRTTVLLAGFQAAGTRGRSLQEGARQVKMMGKFVDVKAKIEKIDGLSAHADRGETLRWLRGFEKPPAMTYLVHGEPESSTALGVAIKEALGWNVRPAADQETVALKAT